MSSWERLCSCLSFDESPSYRAPPYPLRVWLVLYSRNAIRQARVQMRGLDSHGHNLSRFDGDAFHPVGPVGFIDWLFRVNQRGQISGVA